MNKTMGKLIHLLPPKTNELKYTEIYFVPEDTDYIQDHKAFENRRQQLIDEYEKELRHFKKNSMQMI
ncbi:MAG: hypothetical protein K0R50_2398 [Eubacterium sp.]|nr:hypothetical protein [Eubacterium sp.]